MRKGTKLNLTDEQRKRRSDCLKGNKRALGHHPSKEMLERRGKLISKVKTGVKRGPLSEEWRNKIGKSNLGRVVTKETREKISAALRGRKAKPFSKETREKLSMSNKGKVRSEETKKRMSEAHKGQVVSEECRRKLSARLKGVKKDPEVVKRMAATKKGCVFTEEHRKNLSKKKIQDWQNPAYVALKAKQNKAVWQNPENVKKMLRSAQEGPNKPERAVLNILNDLFPNEWKYVGDGQVVINGKCPDFINVNGQKKIIELFGDYWHKGQNPKDRKAVFSPFGYKTLVIWERELKTKGKLIKRIQQFCN